MTPLGDLLIRRIRETGPISIADYMAECLLHPVHGYYTTRPVFGGKGDFTTAPEISQMFGELIGLALAQNWMDQGSPSPFTLAELGPGRGTLMADLLRATRGVPGFQAAARITLVEASPRLREIQREALAGHEVSWIDTPTALPAAPLLLIANEFFDALPICQFQRHPMGWQERVVGLDGERLVPGLSPPMQLDLLEARLSDTDIGEVVEICPAAAGIVAEIAERIRRYGGAAIVIDYGGWHSRGDTFQALAGHAFADPYAAPGTADLTAHVDFEPLALAAGQCAVTAMTDQGVLLERLGITARAQALARHLSGTALEAHVAAHRRLTHPEEMGRLFKAIAIHPKGSAPPPGFD
ncbi:SAM-dependent methyltransferase [Tabrizicola sp. J26]|uniref:class I SAM-dependent methyltransferase n=1 Tax=Alitabrizicola rongguiensis TaxID=2909234 RepID=UPI001F1B48DA|nr:SAM-dependent methyltransferase [Tabrizicola rongguiensis]MCF1710467.1 SAM-dependent methyltransferase [Tabrizicola rongguiensis]